jgi:hypothetical protein|tara:strand:+ start:4034 stop:4180 length:147 start_codon:yes stop_codon:yes gene_type:complete
MTAAGGGKSGYDAANDAAKTRAQQEAARGKGAWDWYVVPFLFFVVSWI